MPEGDKRKKGSQVHIAVDTRGHLLAVKITAANEQESAQAPPLSVPCNGKPGITPLCSGLRHFALDGVESWCSFCTECPCKYALSRNSERPFRVQQSPPPFFFRPATNGTPSSPFRNAMYYVYLIRSQAATDQVYTGFTEDLRQRLLDHNAGKSVHTKKYLPWTLATYLAFSDRNHSCTLISLVVTGR